MNHNFCKHLRTKKMYTEPTLDEAFAEKESAEASPCHFWCNLTQTVTGPDDGPVHRETCIAARSCYER